MYYPSSHSVYKVTPAPKRLCALLASAFALSACGGGGGSDPTSASSSGTVDSPAMVPVNPTSQTDQDVLAREATQVVPTVTSCHTAPAVPAAPLNSLRVTDFGAVPNDDVDDAAAIQAAMNAAQSGQWVIFPPGHYIQSRALQVRTSGVTLYGSGATLHATNASSQAVMLRADNTRMYGFTLTAVTEGRGTLPQHARITALGSDNPKGHIAGVVVQGNVIKPAVASSGTPLSNSASGAGVLLVSVRNFTVAQNRVERSLADGIHMTGRSSNGRVIGNEVVETGDDGIAVVSYLNKSFRTEMTNSSTWYDTTGISSRVSNITIMNNDVSGQYWGRGITVVGGADVTIKENKVSKVAMAAGILVARERVYETHGVTNVLIEGNDVSAIQTTSPAYEPTGVHFTAYESKTAVNGGKTGQAGIEINNTSSFTDATSQTFLRAIKISRVLARNNRISDVNRNAIRLGADSHDGTIKTVTLIGNQMKGARSAPVAASFIGGTPVQITCKDNTYEGSTVSVPSCSSLMTQEFEVIGSTLNCTAFH